MKKVLIIGASSGYGQALVEEYIEQSWIVFGVARSSYVSDNIHTQYEVSDFCNLPLYRNDIKNILQKENDIDLVIFVAGNVILKDKSEHVEQDILDMYANNLGYIRVTIELLELLGMNPDVISFGSQWSYKVGEEYLYWYSIMKHALKYFMKQQEKLRTCYHFYIPTTSTPKAQKIVEEISKSKENSGIVFKKDVTAKSVSKKVYKAYISGNSDSACLLGDLESSEEEDDEFDSILRSLNNFGYSDIINLIK